jgi:hypothetical protein
LPGRLVGHAGGGKWFGIDSEAILDRGRGSEAARLTSAAE